jgi:hypothetical protein
VFSPGTRALSLRSMMMPRCIRTATWFGAQLPSKKR